MRAVLDERAIVRVAVGVVARSEMNRVDAGVAGAHAGPRRPARFEMTTAIVASSVPAAIASMIACRLLPRPEIEDGEAPIHGASV